MSQSPLPSPNPTNSATLASIITETVNAFVGPQFNNITGLLDFETLETDTGVYGQFNTVPIQTDAYYGFKDNGNGTTSIYEAGYTSLYEVNKLNQVIYKTVYGNGNGLIDVIPEPSKTGQDVPVGPPTVRRRRRRRRIRTDRSRRVRSTRTDPTRRRPSIPTERQAPPPSRPTPPRRTRSRFSAFSRIRRSSSDTLRVERSPSRSTMRPASKARDRFKSTTTSRTGIPRTRRRFRTDLC